MTNIGRIVDNLSEWGGIKVKVEDHRDGILVQWKINGELRRRHQKQWYATAIIIEEERDVVIVWDKERYFSKKINSYIIQNVKLVVSKYDYPAPTKDRTTNNVTHNTNEEEWIDPANAEVLAKLAAELKIKQQLKQDETLNKLLEKL